MCYYLEKDTANDIFVMSLFMSSLTSFINLCHKSSCVLQSNAAVSFFCAAVCCTMILFFHTDSIYGQICSYSQNGICLYPCWRYNKGKCHFGNNCRFNHRCYLCGKKDHGATNCNRKKANGSIQLWYAGRFMARKLNLTFRKPFEKTPI